MIEFLTIACLCVALYLLFKLAWIDLQTLLLPNKYVAAFAATGVAFHGFTGYTYITGQDMALGALIGGGFLLIIRTIANRVYKRDTLGLGDVKLMTAAGLWLGAEHILLAITAGAFCGIMHGLWHKVSMQKKTNTPLPLSSLSVPAGPGFIAGILLVGIYKFESLRFLFF